MAIAQIDCPSTYTYYVSREFDKGQGSTPALAISDAEAQVVAGAVAFVKWFAGLSAAAPKCAGGGNGPACQQTITGPTIVFSTASGDGGATAQPSIRYWAQVTATATMSVTCAAAGVTLPPKAGWF